jgi:Uncharacterized conserved protein
MEKTEFDSEFCSVKYIEKDNVVLLGWKKFARFDDYRTPTLFALDLLNKFPRSNFIVDARSGFEDDKEDVAWGFSELLPNMARTECEFVIFIMPEFSDIDNEMDMWTKEFGKYFAVAKTKSFEEALKRINNRILVNVKYVIKPGKRDEFLEKVIQSGIITASEAEPGNCKYEYYKPQYSEDTLFLMEMWLSAKDISSHADTDHYQLLQALKKDYVTTVSIEKFNISKII